MLEQYLRYYINQNINNWVELLFLTKFFFGKALLYKKDIKYKKPQ